MKKRGFTLIELLAVIIILAIVALIATPMVLNVIDDAKLSAAKSETGMILSGIQNYCAAEEMKIQMNALEPGDALCTSPSIPKANVAKMVKLGKAEVTDVTVNEGKYTFKVLSNGYLYTVTSDNISETGVTTKTLPAS